MIIYVWKHACYGTHACYGRSENNFLESVLPVHLYVDSQDQINVTSASQKPPLPAEPSHGPYILIRLR